jgi:peptide chain release factor 2
LKSRLYQIELDKRSALVNGVHENAGDAGWSSKSGPYVLPYQMVKDLRTRHETSDTQGVLDGDLVAFMGALAMDVSGKSRADAADD